MKMNGTLKTPLIIFGGVSFVIVMAFSIYNSTAQFFKKSELVQHSISKEWQESAEMEFPFQLPGIQKTIARYQGKEEQFPIRYGNWRGFMATFKVPAEKLKSIIQTDIAELGSEGIVDLFLSAMTTFDEKGVALFSEVSFFIRRPQSSYVASKQFVQVLHPLAEFTDAQSEVDRGVVLYRFPKILSQIHSSKLDKTLQYEVSLDGKLLFQFSGLEVITAQDGLAEARIASLIDGQIVYSQFDMEHRLYGDSVKGNELRLTWGQHPLAKILSQAIGSNVPYWYRYISDGYGLLSKVGSAGTIVY